MDRIMSSLNRSLSHADTTTRYYVHLKIIRIAANHGRSVMLAEAHCAYTSQLVLTSCARAVADKDSRLAVGLISKPVSYTHLTLPTKA